MEARHALLVVARLAGFGVGASASTALHSTLLAATDEIAQANPALRGDPLLRGHAGPSHGHGTGRPETALVHVVGEVLVPARLVDARATCS